MEEILLHVRQRFYTMLAWSMITPDPRISIEFIERWIDRFPWDFHCFCKRRDLTVEIVRRFKDKIERPDNLYSNPAFTIDEIEQSLFPMFGDGPGLKQSWIFINIHPDITIDRLERYKPYVPELAWIHVASMTKDPERFFKAFPDSQIDILRNNHITEAFIQRHIEVARIVVHGIPATNVSPEFILKHDLPWIRLNTNPRIDLQTFLRIPNRSTIQTAEMHLVLRQLECLSLEWERYIVEMTSGPNITSEFVMLNADIFKLVSGICHNPAIDPGNATLWPLVGEYTHEYLYNPNITYDTFAEMNSRMLNPLLFVKN